MAEVTIPTATLVLSVYVIASDSPPGDEADRIASSSVNRIAVEPPAVDRTLNVSTSNCFVPVAKVGNWPVLSSGTLNPTMKESLPSAFLVTFGVIPTAPGVESDPAARAVYSSTAGSNTRVKATDDTSPVVVARLIATVPLCPAATASELFTTVALTDRVAFGSANDINELVKATSTHENSFFIIATQSCIKMKRCIS